MLMVALLLATAAAAHAQGGTPSDPAPAAAPVYAIAPDRPLPRAADGAAFCESAPKVCSWQPATLLEGLAARRLSWDLFSMYRLSGAAMYRRSSSSRLRHWEERYVPLLGRQQRAGLGARGKASAAQSSQPLASLDEVLDETEEATSDAPSGHKAHALELAPCPPEAEAIPLEPEPPARSPHDSDSRPDDYSRPAPASRGTGPGHAPERHAASRPIAGEGLSEADVRPPAMPRRRLAAARMSAQRAPAPRLGLGAPRARGGASGEEGWGGDADSEAAEWGPSEWDALRARSRSFGAPGPEARPISLPTYRPRTRRSKTRRDRNLARRAPWLLPVRTEGTRAFSAHEDTSWMRLLEMKVGSHHVLSALGVHTTRWLHCARGTPALRFFAREPTAEAASTFAVGDYVVKRARGHHAREVFIMHAGHEAFSGRPSNVSAIADAFDAMHVHELAKLMVASSPPHLLCRARSGEVRVRSLLPDERSRADRHEIFIIEHAVVPETLRPRRVPQPDARGAPARQPPAAAPERAAPTERADPPAVRAAGSAPPARRAEGGGRRSLKAAAGLPAVLAPVELKLFTFGSDIVLVEIPTVQRDDGTFVDRAHSSGNFAQCVPCELTDQGCTRGGAAAAPPIGAVSAARARAPHGGAGNASGAGEPPRALQTSAPVAQRFAAPRAAGDAPPDAADDGGWAWECYEVDAQLRYTWPNGSVANGTLAGSAAAARPPPLELPSHVSRAGMRAALELASTLGAAFGAFSRVDVFVADGGPVIGELTLTPGVAAAKTAYSRWHDYHRERLTRLLGAQWRGIAGGGRPVRAPCWLPRDLRLRLKGCTGFGRVLRAEAVQAGALEPLLARFCARKPREADMWRGVARDIAGVYARYEARLALEMARSAPRAGSGGEARAKAAAASSSAA